VVFLKNSFSLTVKHKHCSLQVPYSFPLGSNLAFVPYLVHRWWHYSPSNTDNTVFFVLCIMLYMFQTLWFLVRSFLVVGAWI